MALQPYIAAMRYELQGHLVGWEQEWVPLVEDTDDSSWYFITYEAALEAYGELISDERTCWTPETLRIVICGYTWCYA